MVTPVALEEFHDRVVDCPFSIADGDALRVRVGGGDAGAGFGAGSTFAEVAGAGATFLAQPAPEMSKAARTIAMAATVYDDLVIGGISFFCALV
jgi:hypothetical protein